MAHEDRLGEPVNDPIQLIKLAEDRKSIIMDRGLHTDSPMPAAIMINWPFLQVMSVLTHCNIYVYVPISKSNRFKK